jgi:hypothetical protein
MGQAKRRRAELGALYGTSEGSNRLPAVQFREMTADEIEALDPQMLANLREEWGRPLRCVMACCGGETVPLVAAPVIDEAGQFNSYAVVIKPQGWLMKDWTARHRDLNRYLLSSTDALIVAP